jgi:hypothetical protein
MVKFLAAFFLLICSLLFLPSAEASAGNSYVSIVNPVRGGDFWDLSDQKPQDAISGETQVLNKYNLNATWLVRYDALKDQSILNTLKSVPQGSEFGVFFEVTPTLTNDSGVKYHASSSWHSAASVFLSGYTPDDRKKLIDTALAQFKKDFGYFPKSVGAWWVDSYSLDYLQQKYGVVASLEVADQYSTDDYQIWGQYFGSPYLPAKQNVLFPAQSSADKLPVVMTQWAARDPVNGYGNGVQESTYSVQPNDYIDYHSLDSNFFSSLVDVYTKQQFNQINQLTVGLENSYSWQKYGGEYDKEMAIISGKAGNQFSVETMSSFASLYLNKFPDVSPTQIIVANDPLGSAKKSLWFMDPYYRLGWFYNNEGSVIRDIRQYVGGSEELCLKVVCNSVNFATTATRVLDDVSFGKRLVLDPGSISDFSVKQNSDNFSFSYLNSAGNKRVVELLKRDIGVDSKTSSVDTFILDALSSAPTTNSLYALHSDPAAVSGLTESVLGFAWAAIRFLLLGFLAFLLPGYFFLRKALKKETGILSVYFLSAGIGIIFTTVLSYVFSFIHLLWFLVPTLLVLDSWVIFKQGIGALRPRKFRLTKLDWGVILVIFLGVILQLIPVFRTGWVYSYGMGFWGANGHDGVWHTSLANALLRGVPPENPALSGVVLKNYHYLFDLLLGISHQFSAISLEDLLFRFYPLLLSLMLGIGSYLLVTKLFKSKVAALISLFFVYFAGSFGWIATYLTSKVLSGESAFWANQLVSFNFNMPFAISLINLIVFLLLFIVFIEEYSPFLLSVLILIAGSLVGFKSYAGILVIATLFFIGVASYLKEKKTDLLKLFIGSSLFSLVFILPNFTPGIQFFIFSPFWLVHSMIDDPDRVGWTRLSMARLAYFERGQWFKFFLVETIGLGLFLVGNLGMKVWGGIYIFVNRSPRSGKLCLSFIVNRMFWNFLIIFSGLSVLIPLIFIQAGNSWNIVQFFYYFMFFGALFSGPALYLFFKKVPKVLSVPLIAIVLIAAPVNSIASANMYVGKNPHTFISPLELQALTFLAKKPEGAVLTMPFDKNARSNLSDPVPLFAYDSTAYVGALSSKPTYYEDDSEQEILQTDSLKRVVAERDFFSAESAVKQTEFLKSANIRYIYILKYFKINIDEQSLNLSKVFDNNEIAIYESKN